MVSVLTIPAASATRWNCGGHKHPRPARIESNRACEGASNITNTHQRKTTMTKRNSPEFMRNRRIVLENEPICHWCHKAPSTEADHLIEVDRGGTDELENLCGSCKKCNATRGNQYLNAKRTRQQHARAEHLGLEKKPQTNQNHEKPQTFFSSGLYFHW